MGTDSSSTTTSEPFNGEARKFVFGEVMPEVRKRLQPFQGYGGQLNYGTTANQTNAYNSLANGATNTQFINDAISGRNLDLSNNTAYQTNLRQLSDQVLRDTNKAFAGVNSSMNRGGLYDSSMRRNALNQQADKASENLANMAEKLTADTWGQERQNQYNAYSQQQNALGNLLSAANYQQTQGQSDLDRTRQEWWNNIAQGDKNLAMVMDFANTIKNPSQSSTQSTSDPLRVVGK